MKYLHYRWLSPVVILSVLFINGCAWKPSARIPKDVTIPQVLGALDRYSTHIKDFSGRASVKLLIDGRLQSANITIRYMNPGRFRIYIKGFAGIDLAIVTMVNDSIAVYIPSENMYVSAGRDKNILGVLLPEFDIDLERMESIFTGTIPGLENREKYHITMKNTGRKVELTMKRDKYMYRYTVEGSNLRPVEEETFYDGVPVWRKKVSGYHSYNGVEFPDTSSIEHGGNVIDLKFSQCSINTGLTENDLLFSVPSSAERMVIE